MVTLRSVAALTGAPTVNSRCPGLDTADQSRSTIVLGFQSVHKIMAGPVKAW
jgi:hypothetical protein